VEIMTDATGDTTRPWAGYLLFVRYGQGDPVATGHVETGYLVYAQTEEDARQKIGALQLNEAVAELNNAISARSAPSRPWWEAMHDEGTA
jgi:hypothetical protein